MDPAAPIALPHAASTVRGAIPAVAALFLVAFAFRPVIVAIGPLMPTIRSDLGVEFWISGLLTTLPVLCLGLFAPVGPWLGLKLGPRLAVAVCVLITVAFGAARTLAPEPWQVLALTFAMGAGMGMAGPLLSITVRLRVPNRPGLATGAYAAGFVVGSSLAALAAIPLETALGGHPGDWRRSLLIIALAGLLSVGAWLLLLAPDAPAEHVDSRPRALPWRRPIAWGLIAVFGLQSIVYFGAQTWLPSVYVDRGWDQAAAASLVGVINTSSIAGTFGAPLVADRWGSRRQQLLAIAAFMMGGLLGVIFLPDAGYVWAALLGIGVGGVFPLVLILPVDVAEKPADIGAAAALMLLGGYLLSSLGPTTLGALRDLTGGFGAVLWALVGLCALFAVAAWGLSPERLRRGLRAHA